MSELEYLSLKELRELSADLSNDIFAYEMSGATHRIAPASKRLREVFSRISAMTATNDPLTPPPAVEGDAP